MKINVHTVPHLTHVASALFSYEILSQVSTQIELVAPNKEEMYPFRLIQLPKVVCQMVKTHSLNNNLL